MLWLLRVHTLMLDRSSLICGLNYLMYCLLSDQLLIEFLGDLHIFANFLCFRLLIMNNWLRFSKWFAV